jgi:hypothetical protein
LQGTAQSSVIVQQADSSVSVSPIGGPGDRVSSLTLAGTLSANAGARFVWTGTFAEGPRAGGHQFFVEEQRADTGSFDLLVETPPGTHVESFLRLQGTLSFTFHEGTLTGPVFTSCTSAESISGDKTFSS